MTVLLTARCNAINLASVLKSVHSESCAHGNWSERALNNEVCMLRYSPASGRPTMILHAKQFIFIWFDSSYKWCSLFSSSSVVPLVKRAARHVTFPDFYSLDLTCLWFRLYCEIEDCHKLALFYSWNTLCFCFIIFFWLSFIKTLLIHSYVMLLFLRLLSHAITNRGSSGIWTQHFMVHIFPFLQTKVIWAIYQVVTIW